MGETKTIYIEASGLEHSAELVQHALTTAFSPLFVRVAWELKDCREVGRQNMGGRPHP